MRRKNPDTEIKIEPLQIIVMKAEKEHIKKCLQLTKYNIQQSSRLLGIARNTLKQRIKDYNL